MSDGHRIPMVRERNQIGPAARRWARHRLTWAFVHQLGYGTGTAWFKRSGDQSIDRELVESVKKAIALGYRHLDGAEGKQGHSSSVSFATASII